MDEESETYRMLHPNAPKLTKREREEMLEEHFDLESDSDDDHEYDANGEAEAADAADAERDAPARRRSAAVAKMKMYAAKDERHAATFREGRRDVSSTSLAERAAGSVERGQEDARLREQGAAFRSRRAGRADRCAREPAERRPRRGRTGRARRATWTESGRGRRSRNGAGWGVLPGRSRGRRTRRRRGKTVNSSF